MYNLLMSNCYGGITTLCAILDDPGNKNAVNLLRGAVFFLGMCMLGVCLLNFIEGMSNWGSQRITSLNIAPSLLLSSFCRVLSWKQEIIAFEVSLAVRRLVTK